MSLNVNTRINVYNKSFKKVAILDNAFDVSYELFLNKISSAKFSLPFSDSKNQYCTGFNYVEIIDENKRVGLFRIIMPQTVRDINRTINIYECEHVFATLLDKILFGFHQVGGVAQTTNVLQYILDQQEVENWVLGDVDFSRNFEYIFENENLYNALISVPKEFDEDYVFTFDTQTYPWTLNLNKISTNTKTYLFYAKNLEGIEKESDFKEFANRIYALGYGEGVNQLNIKDVNSDSPFVEDATSQANFGIVEYALVDRRFQIAENLKQRALNELELRKTPKIKYRINAADISSLTNNTADEFEIGTLLNVRDSEINENFTARVVSIKKNDVIGQPWKTTVEISNSITDIQSDFSELNRRQETQEKYSQGATNIYPYTFSDNADPTHPITVRFYIPEETVRINKCDLSFESSAFRAYSRATEGGGSIATSTAGGGGVSTTTAGGGGVSTTTAGGGAYTETTESGGGFVSTTAAGGFSEDSTANGGFTASSTLDGGAAVESTENAGLHDHIMFNLGLKWSQTFDNGDNYTDSGGDSVFLPEFFKFNVTSWNGFTKDTNGSIVVGLDGYDENIPDLVTEEDAGLHSHTVNIPDHIHDFTVPDHTHSFTTPDHVHNLEYPAHAHGLNIPNHTHSITLDNHTHSITLDNHTHDISLPNHTHNIDYGIFTGTTNSEATIEVDGNAVTGTANNREAFDIVPFLSKDAEGKIIRGFHELQITPNTLGRISGQIFLQLFIQSRGQYEL